MSILTSKRHNFLRKGLCILIAWLFLAMAMMPVRASDEIVYYHNDALGSPVAATDEQGNLLWQEEYQPYGERILKQDNGKNSLWYTGKPEEKDFGINYFGARWYDPSIGRFMAMDSVGFVEGNVHSFNSYAYANNNPYLFVDPDGYEPQPVEVLNWPRSIQWSEFKGMPGPDAKEEDIANTQVGIGYTYDTKEIVIKGVTYTLTKSATVTLTLNEQKSWVKPDEKSENLLTHEQGHYNIAGLVARDFKKKLVNLRVKGNEKKFKNEAAKLHKKTIEKKNERNNRYDKETDHGRNPIMQDKWKRQLDKEKSD